MSILYQPGSFVRHINRPDVKIWVVINCMSPNMHLIKSIPDKDGNYEIARGDGQNLILLDGNEGLRDRGYYRIKEI